MNLREERGAFWWHDEPIPQGHSAPASAVAGQLFVDDEGRSRLELDGNLSRSAKNSPVGFDPMPEGTAIRGVIKDKNQHVLLFAPRRSGFNLSIMSHEKFRAENCIIGDKPFPAGDAFSQLRNGKSVQTVTATVITWRLKALVDAPVQVGDHVLVLRYAAERGHGGTFSVSSLG